MKGVRSIEEQWFTVQKLVHTNPDRPFAATICGPSGVGKTTATSALAATGKAQVYIEHFRANPHLEALLRGDQAGDAFANQKWFLERQGEFISRASASAPILLDQDPAAVVLVYGRLLLEDKRLSIDQYDTLARKLVDIEHSLMRWRTPRRVICLDAPAEVLHNRNSTRDPPANLPPLQWLQRVRSKFSELARLFAEVTPISTACKTPEEIVRQIRRSAEI